MSSIVLRLNRGTRRRLRRMVQKSCDGQHLRRAQAMLFLDEGLPVSEVARRVQAARSTAYRWISWFELDDERALCWKPPRRAPWTVCEVLIALVQRLVRESPHRWGYLRSTWTSEMIAKSVCQHLEMDVHASDHPALLAALGLWPAKSEKLQAIAQASSISVVGAKCSMSMRRIST